MDSGPGPEILAIFNPESVKLEVHDQRYLDPVEGWLGLGDWREANEDLDRIRPELRGHPSVLLARCQIYVKAEKWDRLSRSRRRLSMRRPRNEEAGFSDRTRCMRQSARKR